MCFSFIRLSSLNSSLCHQWSSTPNAQGIFKHVTNKNTQSGSTQILADKNITLRNIESPFTDVDLLRTKKKLVHKLTKAEVFSVQNFFLTMYLLHCFSWLSFTSTTILYCTLLIQNEV